MVLKHTQLRYEGVKRFLSDLRSAPERRSFGDRRCVSFPVILDRRSGADRRERIERRQSVDAYDDAEAGKIRSMICDPAMRVACPACQGHLMLGPPMRRDSGIVRQVHCTICRKSVAIRTCPA